MDVHTVVALRAEAGGGLSGLMYGLLGNLFACCEAPGWLSKMKVHKCSLCHSTIARSV